MSYLPEPPATASRRVPPIGRELSRKEELACAFRILAGVGFAENLSGHITWVDPVDGTMMVNPWGLWWEEVSASDICTVDADGVVVDGRWDVTPAIPIHTELHRARPDALVVIHNHPYWVTVLAAIGVLPEILHQNASLFEGDLAFVSEYTGAIEDEASGEELASLIGDKDVAILASHGVVVTGETIELATFRAYTIDRLCRLNYHVLTSGRDPLAVDASLRGYLKGSLVASASSFWAGAVRRVLRREPDVLE